MSVDPESVPQPLGTDRKPGVADGEAHFASSSPERDHDLQALHEADFVTYNEQQDLRRGLHQRHISLIAIAGAIVSTHRNFQVLWEIEY